MFEPGTCRLRRSQSAQRSEAHVCITRSCPITAWSAGASRSSEGEAPEVPVHQPSDREDNNDQSEYAADPDGSALSIITTAVEPKPASKENHEQHDDQN
jgi:hypothetical protein